MGKKKIIVAVGALFIIGGSAGAGYYLMSRSADASASAEAVEPPYEDPVKDPKYVDIDALLIPFVRDGQVDHHVFLELSLEVDGKDQVQPLLDKKPRLHHAFYHALYGASINTAAGDAIDPEKVKSIVAREAQRLLGDTVKAVHIQNAVRG